MQTSAALQERADSPVVAIAPPESQDLPGKSREEEHQKSLEEKYQKAELLKQELAERPLAEAAQTIALCTSSPHLREKDALKELTVRLQKSIFAERVYDTCAVDAFLVTQVPVLDALFNRVLQHSNLNDMDRMYSDRLLAALQAQRQCRNTVETIKKSKLWMKKTKNLKTK